jgi:DNA/RNA-binding domain of Phe-tRNA-synthetase-like protein
VRLASSHSSSFFQHSTAIWENHPELSAGVVFAEGISADADVDHAIARFGAIATSRLATTTEAHLPEIQAWRRTFAKTGLKPTQYRCASESLLRRFRKEGALPRIHPLIDLCNAISMAYAIPVAALDVSKITGSLEVRHAAGHEEYLTFSGEVEYPDPGEVTFADDDGRAHARRWTNRQSGYSAVRDTTATVLIVAEAMHETAAAGVSELVAELVHEIKSAWTVAAQTALLSRSAPRFTF